MCLTFSHLAYYSTRIMGPCIILDVRLPSGSGVAEPVSHVPHLQVGPGPRDQVIEHSLCLTRNFWNLDHTTTVLEQELFSWDFIARASNSRSNLSCQQEMARDGHKIRHLAVHEWGQWLSSMFKFW